MVTTRTLGIAVVLVCGVVGSVYFLLNSAATDTPRDTLATTETRNVVPVSETEEVEQKNEDDNGGDIPRDERAEKGDDRDQNGSVTTDETPVAPAPSATTYAMAEVEQHNGASSCWTAINGSVYDLTDWISKHPGGERNIMRLCGIDGTAMFSGKHGGDEKPEATLEAYRIGALK